MDLSTTYLGLRLPHPLVVGAGPLSDDLDTVRTLEDAGAAMLVLRSLFEDDITSEQMEEFVYAESHSESFPEAGSFEPDPMTPPGPEEYLEHLRVIKGAVQMPVIASLMGATPEGWVAYAKLLEEAGADGLELQVFHPASDMSMSAEDVERRIIDIVRAVKRDVHIPIAVKLSPLLTAFANFAKQLDGAGADGLVLFNRFHRVDIDVEELDLVRSFPLSDSSDLTLRLRGAAALAGRVRASIALTGGVHTGLDVIKATMAGADVTQMVSALLRHGPRQLNKVRHEIVSWMEEHEWSALADMRGNMSLGRIPDPAAYERANFKMALSR